MRPAGHTQHLGLSPRAAARGAPANAASREKPGSWRRSRTPGSASSLWSDPQGNLKPTICSAAAEGHRFPKSERGRGALPQGPRAQGGRGVCRSCCQEVWEHLRRAKQSATTTTTTTGTIRNNPKPLGNTEFWNKSNHLYFILSRAI